MSNDARRVIGLRGESDAVSVAIVTGVQSQPKLLYKGHVEAPHGAAPPESLAFVRSAILALIDQHKPDRIRIRLPEGNARASNKPGSRNRMRVDGVLLELAGTLRLDVVSGGLGAFSGAFGSTAREGKRTIAEGAEFRGLSLTKLTGAMREAIYAAVSGLEV